MENYFNRQSHEVIADNRQQIIKDNAEELFDLNYSTIKKIYIYIRVRDV